jgi:hypothetical protein
MLQQPQRQEPSSSAQVLGLLQMLRKTEKNQLPREAIEGHIQAKMHPLT